MKTADLRQYYGITAAGAAVLPMLVLGFASSGEAQIFCPTAAGGQTGIALSGGFCTNGNTGALSTASLSSQSLSEVTQTTTQQSTTSALAAIEKRRNEETQRCPEGFERVDGNCRRTAARTTTQPTIAQPARVAERRAPATEPARVAKQRAPATEPARVAERRARATEPARVAKQRVPATEPAPMLYKSPPMIYEPVRYAVWGQGFGDYERRTGSGVLNGGGGPGAPGGLGGPGAPGGLGGPGAGAPLPVNLARATTTWGFNGGVDATYRNVGWLGDILIAGLLTGYMSSNITFNASSLKAEIEGPSVGVYATYLNGPFSADFLARVDFLHVNESFSDILNFNLGTPAGTAVVNGSGATDLNNYVVAGNANYRLFTTPAWWLEPTAGFRFIQSDYDSSAAALGLASGHVWRLQGGLRVGSSFYWGTVLVTPTVTGLAYDDVQITGQVISGDTFAVTPIIPLDEGKVRGQGIFAVNFDYNGLSAFVLADVRGGSDLFGAGGRAGIRYQW